MKTARRDIIRTLKSLCVVGMVCMLLCLFFGCKPEVPEHEARIPIFTDLQDKQLDDETQNQPGPSTVNLSENSDPLTIAIRNASSIDGQASRFQTLLDEAGYNESNEVYVDIGNAQHGNSQDTTYILISEDSSHLKNHAEQIASLIGCKDVLVNDGNWNFSTNILIAIGNDAMNYQT